MPATEPRLTESGKRLYWIFRNIDGEELTPVEFMDLICNSYGLKDECKSCGELRHLCGAGFCIRCWSGVICSE